MWKIFRNKTNKTRKNKSLLVFLLFACLFFCLGDLALAEEGNTLTDIPWHTDAGNYDKEDVPTGGNPISWVAEKVGGVFFGGVTAALYGIYKLVIICFDGSMWLLDFITKPAVYEQVFFSDVARSAIGTAWSFVRDFFNLFFIVIIMFIAISTILKIEKFSAKKNILSVIGAALLINFSMPITLAVIDASQVVMRFFAEAIHQSGNNFTVTMQENIKIKDLFLPVIEKGETMDTMVVFVMLLFSIVFVLIMTFMIFVLALSLLIRLVAFWVLIILSPMAMFGMAIPGNLGSKLKNNWSQNLLSWSFYGPIMLFFLWLALILIDAISTAIFGSMDGFNLEFNTEAISDGESALGDYAKTTFIVLIPYSTAIFFLYYGYRLSNEVSTGAAQGVLKWGDKKMSDWTSKARGYGKAGLSAATLGGTRRNLKEAAKERWEDKTKDKGILRYTTQKGRDRASEEGKARWKDRLGDDSAQKSLDVQRANEKIKKWKDDPPDMDELKEKMASGEGDLATAMYLSQNDGLGMYKDQSGRQHNLYARALKIKGVENNKGVAEKLKRETKKKNGAAVVDQEANALLPGQQNTRGLKTALEENYGKASLKDILSQGEEFFLDSQGKLKPEVEAFLLEKTRELDTASKNRLAADMASTKARDVLKKKNIL
ncbi:MAG: hypothetical protein ACOCUF_01525 [Patescibacteria group bacterium]